MAVTLSSCGRRIRVRGIYKSVLSFAFLGLYVKKYALFG